VGQMVADVPLGAFLSGGVDSSTIVALMQASSPRPVKTFTIGFAEGAYNEAVYAKAVARHLGTDHTELYVTPGEAQAVIPRLPELYDEPYADSSQIPTFLVAQLARQEVTVGLSGDGGDELFGGYNRYFIASRIWNRVGAVPRPLRGAAAHLMMKVPPGAWNWMGDGMGGALPQQFRQPQLADRLGRVAEVLNASSADAVYLRLVSDWSNPEDVVRGGMEPLTSATDPAAAPALPSFAERMMFRDMISYLPDDILVKVDRAAMGVSLETRVPFLDHRVVEFAWRIPVTMKIGDGKGKWPLRKVLHRYVPAELIERPKMGFGLPIDSWLRGPLRQWAEELLDERRLLDEGFFDPKPVRQLWASHLAGARNSQYPLWCVLMFQAWLEHSERGAGCVA
jgi:asparagine synthase (glutamine-hydrolysing)